MDAPQKRKLTSIGSIVQQFQVNFNQLDLSDPKLQVWIVWGPTKAGKTTFFNFINGEILTSILDETNQLKLDVGPNSKYHGTIVHEYTSGTVVPNAHKLVDREDKKIIVVDLAGEQDTKSIDLILVNYFMNSKILMKSNKVKFIITVPEEDLNAGGKFPQVMKIFFDYFKIDQQFEQKLFNSTVLLITKVTNKKTVRTRLQKLSQTPHKSIGKLFDIYQRFIQKSIIQVEQNKKMKTPNLLTFEKPKQEKININGNNEDVQKIIKKIQKLEFVSNLKSRLKFSFDAKIQSEKITEEGQQNLEKLQNDIIGAIKNEIPAYIKYLQRSIELLMTNQFFVKQKNIDFILGVKSMNSQIGWDTPEAQNSLLRSKRIKKVLKLQTTDIDPKNQKANKVEESIPDCFDVLLCLIQVSKDLEEFNKLESFWSEWTEVNKIHKVTDVIIAAIGEIIKLVKFNPELQQIFINFSYHFYTTVQKASTLIEMVQDSENKELNLILSKISTQTIKDELTQLLNRVDEYITNLLLESTKFCFTGNDILTFEKIIIYFCERYPIADKQNRRYYIKAKEVFILAVDILSNKGKVLQQLKKITLNNQSKEQQFVSAKQSSEQSQKENENQQTKNPVNPEFKEPKEMKQVGKKQKINLGCFIKKFIEVNRYLLPHDPITKRLLPNEVVKYYHSTRYCHEILHMLTYKSQQQFPEKYLYAKQTIQFMGSLIYRLIEQKYKYEEQKKKEQNKKQMKKKNVVEQPPIITGTWQYSDALKFFECNFDVKNVIKIKRREIELYGKIEDYIILSKYLSEQLYDQDALKVLDEASQDLKFNNLDIKLINDNKEELLNDKNIRVRKDKYLQNLKDNSSNYKIDKQLLDILSRQMKNYPKSSEGASQCTEATSNDRFRAFEN